MTRVLIVDDHPVFRDGLAGLLATVPGVEVVGSAGSAEEALADLARTAPDVVLMDINLPGVSGVEGTRRALQIASATAVLVISMVDNDSVFAALATVAAGGAGIASRMLAGPPRRRAARLPGRSPVASPVAQDGADHVSRILDKRQAADRDPGRAAGSPGGSAAAGSLSLPTGPVTGMLIRVIDPDSAVPPYEQVAKMLRDEIAQGTMIGRIPSVHTIAEHHHVSHRVAARALEILKGEGMVVSRPGEGDFVRHPREA